MTQTQNPPTKVFIDSSVLIAAAISASGAARLLLTAGFLDQLKLAVSSDVFKETERNLHKTLAAALPALEVFREALVAYTVEPDEAAIRQAALIVAAKEVPILAGAIAVGAQHLATFDQKHLLNEGERISKARGIVAATPSDTLRRIHQPS